MFNTCAAIIRFDLRSISRDRLFLTIVLLITALIGALAVVGYFHDALGISGVRQWLPYVLILAVISNPASYGMVFGLLLIEEVETRVRAALMTTPFSPVWFILMRTPLLVIMLALIGFAMGFGMGEAWGVGELSGMQWLAIALATAMIGPGIMISLSTLASNRLEAMAMGKFYSWLVTPPILLYLLPDNAWYLHLFLIFPTTPVVHAYEAFRHGHDQMAMRWLLWALVYAAAFTTLAVRRYLRKSYGLV